MEENKQLSLTETDSNNEHRLIGSKQYQTFLEGKEDYNQKKHLRTKNIKRKNYMTNYLMVMQNLEKKKWQWIKSFSLNYQLIKNHII